MSSLMPLAKDISAFRAPPVPSQFKEDTFLGTLELSGPQLTSTVKGDFEGLYKRFFRSSNFRGWYESRRMEQLEKLEELHREALAKEDFNKWMRGKQEVEIVDMILCIKNKLQLPVNSNSTLSPPEPRKCYFLHDFGTIYNKLHILYQKMNAPCVMFKTNSFHFSHVAVFLFEVIISIFDSLLILFF